MPADKPVKKRRAGWFVEVPPELKEEFKAYYPGRSAMTRVTIIAIKMAIKTAKANNLPRNDRDDKQGDLF